MALIRTDLYNKGESALSAEYINEDNIERVYAYDLLLHRPAKGAPLEPIR